MGLSSSKSKSKTVENKTETGTTTPTNPPFVTNALQDFTNRVAAFGRTDPSQYVAPASQLQQDAWANADNLGDWFAQNQAATGMAAQAGNAGPNLARAKTYRAPNLRPAALSGAASYQAPQLGQANTYSAPTLGPAAQAVGNGYTSSNANASNASAASLLDGGLDRYLDPYTSNVIDATLGEFDDNAGRIRAQQAAQAAKAGAFGGSRYAIREAQTENDLARTRALTQAGLLNDGFNTAAGLAQSDAANRQQASLFNAQNQTGVSLANAGAANQAAQFGAAAGNTASLANQQANNLFGLTQAGFTNDANRYAADARNQFALTQAGLSADAGQFNAANQQQSNLFNAGALNDFVLAQAGFDQNAGQFNANAENNMSQFNAGQRDDALTRQLQAAGLMGDLSNSYADNVRGDLGLLSALGADQRDIDQAQRLALPAQLQLMGDLYGQGQFNLFNGQTINATSNGTSMTNTKSSPGLFQSLLAIGNKAANAYAMGGG